MEMYESIRDTLVSNGALFSLEEIKEALDSLSQIPKNLIVTDIPVEVFDNEEFKLQFERLFTEFDEEATFAYLKSFRRAKVYMTKNEAAVLARFHLHKTSFFTTEGGSEPAEIKVFFSQDIDLTPSGPREHLEPPLPEKQFLISPPASPPVGWESGFEAQPALAINYDLLAALASLAPGESHELHPAEEGKPGIIVTPCDEDEDDGSSVFPRGVKPKILQTRCPDRKS